MNLPDLTQLELIGVSAKMSDASKRVLMAILLQPGIRSDDLIDLIGDSRAARRGMSNLSAYGWVITARIEGASPRKYFPAPGTADQLRVVVRGSPEHLQALAQETGRRDAECGTAYSSAQVAPRKPRVPYVGQVVPPRTINLFQPAPPPSRLSGPYIRPGSLRNPSHPSVWCGQRVAPTVRLTAAQGGQE